MRAQFDAGKIAAKRDFIAKRRREQMRVRIASDVAEHRLVIDVAALLEIEARGVCKPHRQHARPQRKLSRLTSGEVRRVGQRDHEVGATDCRCSHRAQLSGTWSSYL